ncbi:MAG: sigma-54-dependent Fis family transcriptional regulator, partial [Muribaculaceae bacterium]|nr:sigma-54-dependent Fis family transcriptional regulator [Muribaculaceae bacterium]
VAGMDSPTFKIENQIPVSMSTALTKASHHSPHIIDIDAVDDTSSLSSSTVPDTLEETEKETIRKSLLRNDGRRKITAQELNISERTLYRKIKEYGLE